MVIPLSFLVPVPFLVAAIVALIIPKGKSLGYLGVIAGLCTFALVLHLALAGGPSVQQMSWFSVAGTTFVWSVLADKLSLLLAGIVAGIGTLIFLYSIGYLEPTEDLKRFYAVLGLFAAAMLGVVTSENLFQLFFCWELVGVSSYLLIGFWHDRESAIVAARKAFLTIIIGDAFLLFGILLLWHEYGTFSITQLLVHAHLTMMTTIAGACIIVGAISKSAQFPLHTWLPDAMEGPTPVSAFLHSATMVKAGLFLIARMLPLLILAGLSPVLVVIAVITIIISACCALVENDVKRVLAYSTMNQLAFILLALGLGATAAGLYHLLNHSIFKALLFMSAGVIIHLAGTQDITKMNLKRGWNLLALTTLVGAMALAGLPPFSGFFSKDAILEAVLHTDNAALIVVFCVAILLSSLYIFRWYFLIFRKDGALGHINGHMRMPLPLLALLTALGGFAMMPFFSLWGDHASLGVASVVSVCLSGIGLVCAYLIYVKKSWDIDALASSPIAQVFRARFMVDDFYSWLAGTVASIGSGLSWVDDHIINRLIESIVRFLGSLAAVLRKLVTGHARTYLVGIVIGFIIIALVLRFT